MLSPETIELHGVKVNLSHDNISPELRAFFYNESYEGEEINILKKYLRADDVVMEIGAGIGFLSTFCAKKVGNDRVFAYEANPFMVDKIKETYALNGVSPVIENVLLSDGDGSVNFYLEKNFWSSSTVKRSDDSERIEVATRNINDDIQRIDPTFLIIDIEGGEKELIPLIDFHNIRKLIIEIHPHVIGQREASRIVEYLISRGFSLNFSETKGIVFMFERVDA